MKLSFIPILLQGKYGIFLIASLFLLEAFCQTTNGLYHLYHAFVFIANLTNLDIMKCCLMKFRFSEKALKCGKKSLFLTLLSKCQNDWEIVFQILWPSHNILTLQQEIWQIEAYEINKHMFFLLEKAMMFRLWDNVLYNWYSVSCKVRSQMVIHREHNYSIFFLLIWN